MAFSSTDTGQRRRGRSYSRLKFDSTTNTINRITFAESLEQLSDRRRVKALYHNRNLMIRSHRLAQQDAIRSRLFREHQTNDKDYYTKRSFNYIAHIEALRSAASSRRPDNLGVYGREGTYQQLKPTIADRVVQMMPEQQRLQRTKTLLAEHIANEEAMNLNERFENGCYSKLLQWSHRKHFTTLGLPSMAGSAKVPAPVREDSDTISREHPESDTSRPDSADSQGGAQEAPVARDGFESPELVPVTGSALSGFSLSSDHSNPGCPVLDMVDRCRSIYLMTPAKDDEDATLVNRLINLRLQFSW